jgi:hypothetical protein
MNERMSELNLMLYLRPYLNGLYILQVENRRVTVHYHLPHGKDVRRTRGIVQCVINFPVLMEVSIELHVLTAFPSRK